jgi:hypothetical protein
VLSDLAESQVRNIMETLATGDAGDLSKLKDDKFEMHFDYLRWPLIARIMPTHPAVYTTYSMEEQKCHLGAMLLLRSTVKRRPTRFTLNKWGNSTRRRYSSGGTGQAVHVSYRVTILLASIKPYLDIISLFIESKRRFQY